MALTFLNYQEEIIGRGLKVPECFDSLTGKTQVNSGIDRINQSIHHILSTRVGTRFLLPEFGSKLYTILFEPNDYIIRDLCKLYVEEALAKWEPRINNVHVQPVVETGGNSVPIYITYTLINTNISGNYVYPFNREVYEVSE